MPGTNTLYWRVRGENKARLVASQGGAPATEATVRPSDKLEAGRLLRTVFEQFRHEETKAGPDQGLGIGKGWLGGE